MNLLILFIYLLIIVIFIQQNFIILMMSLFKSEIKILNKIYCTTIFNELVGNFTSVENIDYTQIQNYVSKVNHKTTHNIQQKVTVKIVDNANILCQKQKAPSEDLKQAIINFNELLVYLPQKQYIIQHIMIYSSLSKCRIWPRMLKVSSTLVPTLVAFYNRFIQDFNNELQFKFDPVILSTKYQKIMNKVQAKKQDNPKLFDAIRKNNIETISQMLQISGEQGQQYLNLFVTGTQQKYVAHVCIEESQLKMIQHLWKLGVNFQLQDKQKQTPLFYAVKRADKAIIQFLIDVVKVNVNHTEYQNRTPLYLAAFQGNLQLVDFLFKKGANPHIQSKLSRTPLSKACYLGNVKVVQYLISIGVDLQTIDSKGRTALHNAAWGIEGGRNGKRRGVLYLEDSPQSAELLLKAGHKIDFQDFDDFTPLFSAASSKAIRSMDILIKYGANLKHVTKKQQSVCFIAARYGHLQVLQHLIEKYNCDFITPNCDGYYPLMAASTLDQLDCFEYLLQKHIDKDIPFDLSLYMSSLIEFGMQKNFIEFIKSIENKIEKQDNLSQKKTKQYFKNCLVQTDLKQLKKLLFRNHNALKIFTKFFLNPIVHSIIYKSSDEALIKFLNSMIKGYTNLYNKKPYEDFIKLLEKYKDLINRQIITLHEILINEQTPQQHIIKFLQMETNLTKNVKNFKVTLESICYYRMSAALIWLLKRNQENHKLHIKVQNKYGIDKIEPQQLLLIVTGNLQQTQMQTQHLQTVKSKEINLFSYCIINHLFDMITILKQYFKEFQNPEDGLMINMKLSKFIEVPKYEVSYIQTQLKIAQISSLGKRILTAKQLLESMKQQQSQAYALFEKQDVSHKFVPDPKNYVHVDSIELMQKAVIDILKHKIVGVDVEHFSAGNGQFFVCLVQISTCSKVYLFDALAIPNQNLSQGLQKIYHNTHTLKIMHSYDSDLRWLNEDFGINKFQNVIDTCKLWLLDHQNKNHKSPSLKQLCKNYLNYEMSKDYQKADWRIRPFVRQMLHYAAIDAQVLPKLYIRMLSKIKSTKEIEEYFCKDRSIKTKGIKNTVKLINAQNEEKMIANLSEI